MKAKKYISKKEVEIDNKTYELVKSEVREVELLESDWYWLYTNIMNDDYEIAYSNGLTEYEDTYCSIDCQRVAERMEEWKELIKEDGEIFDDYNEKFKNNYIRILDLLCNNLDFTIYYEEKNND